MASSYAVVPEFSSMWIKRVAVDVVWAGYGTFNAALNTFTTEDATNNLFPTLSASNYNLYVEHDGTIPEVLDLAINIGGSSTTVLSIASGTITTVPQDINGDRRVKAMLIDTSANTGSLYASYTFKAKSYSTDGSIASTNIDTLSLYIGPKPYYDVKITDVIASSNMPHPVSMIDLYEVIADLTTMNTTTNIYRYKVIKDDGTSQSTVNDPAFDNNYLLDPHEVEATVTYSTSTNSYIVTLNPPCRECQPDIVWDFNQKARNTVVDEKIKQQVTESSEDRLFPNTKKNTDEVCSELFDYAINSMEPYQSGKANDFWVFPDGTGANVDGIQSASFASWIASVYFDATTDAAISAIPNYQLNWNAGTSSYDDTTPSPGAPVPGPILNQLYASANKENFLEGTYIVFKYQFDIASNTSDSLVLSGINSACKLNGITPLAGITPYKFWIQDATTEAIEYSGIGINQTAGSLTFKDINSPEWTTNVWATYKLVILVAFEILDYNTSTSSFTLDSSAPTTSTNEWFYIVTGESSISDTCHVWEYDATYNSNNSGSSDDAIQIILPQKVSYRSIKNILFKFTDSVNTDKVIYEFADKIAGEYISATEQRCIMYLNPSHPEDFIPGRAYTYEMVPINNIKFMLKQFIRENNNFIQLGYTFPQTSVYKDTTKLNILGKKGSDSSAVSGTTTTIFDGTILYVGFTEKILENNSFNRAGIYFSINTAGSTGTSLTLSYSISGGSWATGTLIDNTQVGLGNSMQLAGSILTTTSNWEKTTINGEELYWLKFEGTFGTPPTVNYILPCYYSNTGLNSALDVSFDSNTVDVIKFIESIIDIFGEEIIFAYGDKGILKFNDIIYQKANSSSISGNISNQNAILNVDRDFYLQHKDKEVFTEISAGTILRLLVGSGNRNQTFANDISAGYVGHVSGLYTSWRSTYGFRNKTSKLKRELRVDDLIVNTDNNNTALFEFGGSEYGFSHYTSASDVEPST